MVGKAIPIPIYELMGVEGTPEADVAWLSLFADAVGRFTEYKLDEAEKLFGRVIEIRGGADGPSKFYLKEIVEARRNPPAPETWDGVVIVTSK
jgi:hypothetical protein